MTRHLILLLALCAALAACRSSRSLERGERLPEKAGTATNDGQTDTLGGKDVPAHGEDVSARQAAAAELAGRAAAIRVAKPCVTASVRVSLTGLGKDVSVNGSLRMKRDDVVRLSLRFLGMEVGLLEFTPEDVLVVDRINKQYVRAAYAEVSFLRQAGLDFYALQSLFWNELFLPGTRAVSGSAARFSLRPAEGLSVLSPADTPLLAYDFYTDPATALVHRLSVKGRRATDRGTFEWTYADFAPFAGRSFPRTMQMSVRGTRRDIGLGLSLSQLKTDSDWPLRTTVSSKYARRSLDEVLGSLGSL